MHSRHDIVLLGSSNTPLAEWSDEGAIGARLIESYLLQSQCNDFQMVFPDL
jgi:hypothetical protein